MKKFLNIRNILIILIIIVAVVFICLGRSDNPKDSKAYQLFNHFYEYGPEYGHNENNTTMKLENTGDKEITWIYATDYDNEREIVSSITLGQTSKETKQHVQLVNITSKKGRESYIMLDADKMCYKFDTAKEDASEIYASWARNVIDLITNNSYYTRGYEWVDGNFMYYEYFKDTDIKFYFDSDGELRYLSARILDSSVSSNPDEESYIYKVTISHDSIDNSLIQIPEDYEIIDAEQNGID